MTDTTKADTPSRQAKAEVKPTEQEIETAKEIVHEYVLGDGLREVLTRAFAQALADACVKEREGCRDAFITLIDSYEIENPLSQYGIDVWEAGVKHLRTAIRKWRNI